MGATQESLFTKQKFIKGTCWNSLTTHIIFFINWGTRVIKNLSHIILYPACEIDTKCWNNFKNILIEICICCCIEIQSNQFQSQRVASQHWQHQPCHCFQLFFHTVWKDSFSISFLVNPSILAIERTVVFFWIMRCRGCFSFMFVWIVRWWLLLGFLRALSITHCVLTFDSTCPSSFTTVMYNT